MMLTVSTTQLTTLKRWFNTSKIKKQIKKEI